jgi:triphosphatase
VNGSAASTAKIKVELKWLTNELAPAREIDVLVKEKIRPLHRVAGLKRDARAVDNEFSARRNKAFRHTRQVLDTPRYRNLLIDVLEWLETGRSGGADESRTAVGEYVGKLLRRRVRKARKEGRDLEALPAPERHKLRIRIKKLRYAADFFQSLYSAADQKQLAQFSARLKRIQDDLGALNDFIAHREMATDAALNAPPQNRRARAFASGVLVGQENEVAKTLVRTARAAFKRLRPLKAKPR